MIRVVLSFYLSVVVLLTTACSPTQKVVPLEDNKTVVSSTPPFQTKEPERYRATRTITTIAASGETLVTKNWIARDGELRRDETEFEGRRVVSLDLLEGRFVVVPNEELFAELVNTDQAGIEDDSESSPDRLLHTDPMATTYQRVGTETIGGRSTQKYRVVVNSSPDANVSVSETMIWVDDALQMPIRSEMKSPNGARTTMELTDIASEVDAALFRVPEGYKKITFAELLKRLKLD